MSLDTLVQQAMSQCTEMRLLVALREIYPDIAWTEEDDLPELTKWLAKSRQRPRLALSTGRRNSFKGMATCALLRVLEVESPKAPRTAHDVAWAVLDSAEGQRIVGDSEEREAKREERRLWWLRAKGN